MSSIYVFGHSFVRRLHDELKDDRITHGHEDFGTGLPTTFDGRAGLTASRAANGSVDLKRIKAGICFIQLGENDISFRVHSDEIVDSIMYVVDRILAGRTKTVIVGALFPRFGGYRRCDWELYDEMYREINRCLKEIYYDNQEVIFWDHERSMRRPLTERFFIADGVHLTGAGNYRFYRSIKSSINYALLHHLQ
jgi:lysophospholipase L1-like esterase